jgi:hypothetical protein
LQPLLQVRRACPCMARVCKAPAAGAAAGNVVGSGVSLSNG